MILGNIKIYGNVNARSDFVLEFVPVLVSGVIMKLRLGLYVELLLHQTKYS